MFPDRRRRCGFSCQLLSEHPLAELIDLIVLADELRAVAAEGHRHASESTCHPTTCQIRSRPYPASMPPRDSL
jgi:hypothetical protein